MATVDRTSVRAQFEEYKAQFETLRQQGKLSQEAVVLFNGMMLMMDLMITLLLEKMTRKRSTNSSLPPSSDEGDGTAAGTARTGSKGPVQKTCDNAHLRQTSITETSKVTACSGCGRSMVQVACAGHETRTLVDIVFDVVTTRVEAEIKTCPDCRTESRGAFPDTMPGPLQYGHGIIAFAIHQMVAHMVPLRRLAQTMKVITGASIAEATLLAWCRRLDKTLKDWEKAAINQLLASPVLHTDETSIRINRKNHWLHNYSAGSITLLFCHPNRGRSAMDFFNIIPRYGGILIHDRWSSYLSFENCSHALCGAHLLRDLQFIVDANGHAWARHMITLLTEAARKVRKSQSKTLSREEDKSLRSRYRTILTKGRRELPPPVPRPAGRRGRIAKSDAENLLEALVQYEDQILLFARNPHVAFTNNRSERDIRMAKVKQKVSGCFRSAQYAAAWCRIYSYLKSMAHQGYNPLTAIQIALNGKAAEMIRP